MYHAHKVKSLTCDLLGLGLYLQTLVAQVFDPVCNLVEEEILFWYEKGVTQLRLIFCKKSTQLVPSDCSWWPRPLSVPFLFPTSSNLTVTLAQPFLTIVIYLQCCKMCFQSLKQAAGSLEKEIMSEISETVGWQSRKVLSSIWNA